MYDDACDGAGDGPLEPKLGARAGDGSREWTGVRLGEVSRGTRARGEGEGSRGGIGEGVLLAGVVLALVLSREVAEALLARGPAPSFQVSGIFAVV